MVVLSFVFISGTLELGAVLPQSAKMDDVLKDMESSISSQDFKHVGNRLEFLSKHLEKGEASRADQQRLVFIATSLVYGLTEWISKRPSYGFDMLRMEAMNNLNNIQRVLDELDEKVPQISVAKNAIQAFYGRSGGMFGMGMGGAMPGMGGMSMGNMGMGAMPAMGGMPVGGIGMGAMPGMAGMPMGNMGMGAMPAMGGVGAPMAETMVMGGGTVKTVAGRKSLPEPIPSIREKDIKTPLEQAQRGLKKLGNITKPGDRANNFINAMKSLKTAIDAANTIKKYADVERFTNADSVRFYVSNDTIVEIGKTAIQALKKVSVSPGAAGLVGVSDDNARIAFAEVVAAIQGELGVKERYIYGLLSSLSPKDLKKLEEGQKMAEHRVRKVIGEGLLATVRSIMFDYMPGNVEGEKKAHKEGLKMLVKIIKGRIHKGVGPRGEVVGAWKKFKDREVQLIAKGISIGLKRLDLTRLERGFDDPESFKIAMDVIEALLSRVDLMYEIKKNASGALSSIWKQLPQLGKRIGGMDRRQEEFFKQLGKAYEQGLSNEQDTKIVITAGQFLGRAGLTPAELIPAGWGIYVVDNDEEAASRIIQGANYLGWAIMSSALQAYENRQKKEQDKLASAYKMLGWSARLTTKVPVFKGVSSMVGNIVVRLRDKLLTIGGLKDSGEAYVQLAKVLNLLRGEFIAPEKEKVALKSGLNILFRDFDESVKSMISKDLGRAMRRAKEEGYDSSKEFMFDVTSLAEPPAVTELYGGSFARPKAAKEAALNEDLEKKVEPAKKSNVVIPALPSALAVPGV